MSILDRIAALLGCERVRIRLDDNRWGEGYGIIWRRLRGASGRSSTQGRGEDQWTPPNA
jgi:hypothetical protein